MQAQKNGSVAVPMVEVLVTTAAISAEEEITADKLRLEQWPADRVPQGASPDLSEFEGRFAKVPLFAGEPVLDMKLMDEVEDKVVPRGYTVVSLEAGRDGTANLVSPGDRVDLRGFFVKGEMFARDMALDVLTGVKVYGVNGITKFDPEQPRNRSARDIQLLIRKADVEAFDFAKKYGDISLSLGSPSTDDETIPEGEQSEAARQFMRDLQERRQEQERLRQLAQREEPEEPGKTEPAGKKTTFRMMKMHEGKLTEYEWLEGEALPRVLRVIDNERSDGAGSTETSTGAVDDSGDALETDFLRGADSPFFSPAGTEPAETN